VEISSGKPKPGLCIDDGQELIANGVSTDKENQETSTIVQTPKTIEMKECCEVSSGVVRWTRSQNQWLWYIYNETNQETGSE